MRLARPLHGAHAVDEPGAGLAVGVGAHGARALGQHPAPVHGRVDHGDAGRHGLVYQGLGRTVDQGVAVVREQHLERARSQEPLHEPDGTARDPYVLRQTLVAHRDQGLDRPGGGHGPLEGDLVGIVQVKQLEPVGPEPFEALLGRTAGPVAAKATGNGIRVDLGGQDETVREPAALGDGGTNAAFALAVAVTVGRVEEVDGAIENMLDGPDAPLVLDVLAEHPGHAAEGRRAHANGRYHQRGAPEASEGQCAGRALRRRSGLVHRHSPGKSPLRDTTPAYHRALDLGIRSRVLKSTQTSPKR